MIFFKLFSLSEEPNIGNISMDSLNGTMDSMNNSMNQSMDDDASNFVFISSQVPEKSAQQIMRDKIREAAQRRMNSLMNKPVE